MHIVLLSGGSGKRLWPLSNDIRSKQFIKLFRNENGVYESMLQRVYRQILSAIPNATLTIATSQAQVSSIRHQLGDKVNICVEPSRRDTFPAIVLAASYLRDIIVLDENECIIVCPIDPYVDNAYFETMQVLETLARDGTAQLTLMGVEPTYPSETYGYIIPESDAQVCHVKTFKEKPDVQRAQVYINDGALWNAGVFAFRLGYVLGIARATIGFDGYHALYENYHLLTKTSFDYMVVEKETNICVVRYTGAWMDIGTWDMVASVMCDTAKGNVTLDETCENTHVINEKDTPILCMGCRNMIIAASEDGILVLDRARGGNIKPYVERISGDVRFAEKSWGTFTVLDTQHNSMTARIVLQQGKEMKYHSHAYRSEVWIILSGEGEVLFDGVSRTVYAGDVLRIPIGCKHKIAAYTQMLLLETQIGECILREDKQTHQIPPNSKDV